MSIPTFCNPLNGSNKSKYFLTIYPRLLAVHRTERISFTICPSCMPMARRKGDVRKFRSLKRKIDSQPPPDISSAHAVVTLCSTPARISAISHLPGHPRNRQPSGNPGSRWSTLFDAVRRTKNKRKKAKRRGVFRTIHRRQRARRAETAMSKAADGKHGRFRRGFQRRKSVATRETRTGPR